MSERKLPVVVNFLHGRLHSHRSIRLLSLHPSSNLSAPLVFSLFEASLDDFPSDSKQSYEALSYVWGAPIGSVPCICDGRQLLLTPNCNEALQHLRFSEQHRILWVDAICIDQGTSTESLKERNVQITLMGEIYRTAERTLCWLGSGEEYTAGTFERLHRIGSCPSKRELRKLLGYDEQLRQKGTLKIGSTCLDHIFCHPWHSRVWTLQEVVFSKVCQVTCGNETISWDLYFAAARLLIYDEFIDELDAQAWKNYVSIGIREDMRNSLLHMTTEDRDEDTRMALLTSGLTQVRHLQATNPKDRIYGLYAVFSTLGISLPAPDYNKSLEKIYEEACLAIIFHSRSLQMLEYASSNARAPSLPTWVADWQDENVTLVNPPTSSATEGSRISHAHLSILSPAAGQLRVKGRIIGAIAAKAENDFATLEFPPDSLPILKGEKYEFVGEEIDSLRLLVHRIRLFREWMHLIDEVPPPAHPVVGDEDASSTDIFYNLLTFDSVALFASAPSDDARLFNAWIDILLYPNTSYDLSHGVEMAEKWKRADEAATAAHDHWSPEISHCAIIAAALASKSAACDDGQIPLEVAQLLDFTAHVAGNMGNRALILVRDEVRGLMVPGTAFHAAKMGDEVVLLQGADAPQVLRRRRRRQDKNDEWAFVGPAYMLGIMDGEAWSDEEEEGAELTLRDFVLV